MCSCGETDSHVVAKRKTFDNYSLLFWDDGAVTTGMGGYVVRGGRTEVTRERAIAANRKFSDNACLYEFSGVAAAVRAARKEV